MANILGPRGFIPRRASNEGPYNGGVKAYKLASGYGTNIFIGDVVKLVGGYIQKAGASDQIRGVLAGVDGTLVTGQPFIQRYWIAGTTTKGAQDAVALIYDDPNILFEAQFCNSTSVPATADLGKYYKLFDTGGTAGTAQSGEGMDYSTGTATSTAGVFRFVSFLNRPNNDLTSAYSRGLFVPTLHDLRVTSGAV